MKSYLQSIKQHFLLLCIKIILLSIFIYCIVRGINNFLFYSEINISYSLWDSFFSPFLFLPATSLLIPIIGILINKKIGWVFIQSYFYLLFINLTFPSPYYSFSKNSILRALTLLIVIIFILTVILMMNTSKISYSTYGILKRNLLYYNIIAFTLGMLISIFQLLVKNELL